MRLRLVIMLVLASAFVLADMGPKPTADIELTLDGRQINTEAYGVLLSCMEERHDYGRCDMPGEVCRMFNETVIQDSCTWRWNKLAWGGCETGSCHFHYHLPERFRLAVYIPELDQTFITDPVTRKGFHSSFSTDLSMDGTGTIVETTPLYKLPKISSFIFALIATLLIEMIVAVIIFWILKVDKKNLLWVALMNIISLPVVWFVFPIISIVQLMIVGAELFAFAFEASFLHYIAKLSLKRSIITSLVLNIASFVIGGVALIAYMLIFGF